MTIERASPSTEVGTVLDGIKKVAVIQIMGSRHWGRVNPIHFDPVTAADHQDGEGKTVATVTALVS